MTKIDELATVQAQAKALGFRVDSRRLPAKTGEPRPACFLLWRGDDLVTQAGMLDEMRSELEHLAP